MTEIKPKIIRNKGFANRLNFACDKNPHCPPVGQGRQKWLRDNLLSTYSISVSAEGARRWFAGEVTPRKPAMNKIAALLKVDESWLSLGITPDESPDEKHKRNAIADGAVNYIAGLVQLWGGHIAFPDVRTIDDNSPDLFAIIQGRQHSIQVKRARRLENGQQVFNVPARYENTIVIGVIETASPMMFDMLRLSTELIETHGQDKGGYIELVAERKGSRYFAGSTPIPQITNFDNLKGTIPPGPSFRELSA